MAVTTMSDLLCVEDLLHEDTDVKPYLILSHPLTFIESEHYLYLDNGNPVLRDVKFVAYTSCPAMVVVLSGSGQKVRVLRDNLYTRLAGNKA
jgi:hypothetical protein